MYFAHNRVGVGSICSLASFLKRLEPDAWTLGGKTERLHACISQDPTYLLGEQRVPVVDEVSCAKEEHIP